MQASEARRAVAAAMASATAQGLSATDATVLNDSNRLVLRLMPCDVVARVAPTSNPHGSSALEVEVVRRLAETDSPVTALEPRVEPRADVRDGFVVSMWKYYESEPVQVRELPAADYTQALARLHAGQRNIDLTTTHFLDRVAGNQQDVADRDATPDLPDADRTFLADTLERLRKSILDRGGPEQLLHGEPHPWNILNTKDGLLFMDFENTARGPVEYDLGWVPVDVSASIPAPIKNSSTNAAVLRSRSSQRATARGRRASGQHSAGGVDQGAASGSAVALGRRCVAHRRSGVRTYGS